MSTSLQIQHQPSGAVSTTKESMLASLQEQIGYTNLQWDGRLSMKMDGVPPTTRSLKEMLVAKCIEVEASTNANITAEITMSDEPDEVVDCFEKLMKFCSECVSASRVEVALVTYPVFMHVCLHLFTRKSEEQAKYLREKFSGSFEATQQAEVTELFSFSSGETLLASELANKFRTKKYCIRMSSKAFQLLMQFLLTLHTPYLMSLIQRHLALEVYGSTPVIPNETTKLEPKKSLSFFKPRVSQLDENRLLAKIKQPSRSSLSSSRATTIPPKVTPPAKVAKMAEYREALATSAELIDPTPPSLAMYCIHSTENNVHCASINSNSKLYACGFADSSIHVWPQEPDSASSHMTRAQPIGLPDTADKHRVLVGHSGPVYATCFSVDGKYLISGSEDSSIRLWDLERNASIVTYHGHTYPVWDVSFSPIDIQFASASMDCTARLWNTDLVFPLRLFAGHTSHVNMVRFHPNGHYIATGSHDRSCRLWDVDSGQCVRLMATTKSSVISIAFSPNGKELASGGLDGVTRVWDLGSGDLVREYPAPSQSVHRGGVSSLAYSLDSTLLAASSHLNCINVYNTRQASSENAVLSHVASPKTCSILHVQFTHRNCLFGISKLDTPTKGLTLHGNDINSSSFNGE